MTSIFSRRDVQSWRTSLEVYRDGTRRSLVPGVTRSPQETITTVLAAVANVTSAGRSLVPGVTGSPQETITTVLAAVANVTSAGRILLLLAYNYIAWLIR